MITGMHAILYTKHVDDVHSFLGEVLGLPSVDAGGGRLIYAAPPTEIGVHETDGEAEHELYLICDDVHATVAKLAEKGVETTMPVADRGWGLVTSLRLPGGDEIGLYEPKHASPLRGAEA
ncbi:MAG: extradiol dioxygenase [Candidatus Eremiobacteraeota bacterium]|nr:extradiol dioxygenase [Candidatus Eremiobacteraeota bacterium]MBC5809716.1 extradiol dioxygenase [Candidatus Eremiobacteraeota bacterium]